MTRFFIFFLFSLSFLYANDSDDLLIDLRNPTYKNGILYTKEGGVIKNQDIRIQARSIQYTKTKHPEVHKIEAEGDLMILYKGRVYVGKEIVYDFLSHSGIIYEGKTFSSPWYLGADQLLITADGSSEAKDAFMTACENKDSSWDISAAKAAFFRQNLFQAENIHFRILKMPLLWFPILKLNLQKFEKSILRKTITWDSGQGPRAEIRAQLYSWRDFALFGRVGYRWGTGWQGALETDYAPPDSRTTFVTRSYVGTDRLTTAPDKEFRYRLQGDYHWASTDHKTEAAIKWDKYNDVRMPSDFKSDDFEVNSAKQTLFWLHAQRPFAVTSFKVRPRVNLFESIKQDLPTFYSSLLPFNIGKTGIISSFRTKVSYLDFAYSDQLSATYPFSPLSDYRSGRFEAQQFLYRPFHLGPLLFTPNIGGIGIFYTNSASHKPKALGLLNYGADFSASGYRSYETCKHKVEPYFSFSALSKPNVSSYNHYVFSIQDGYAKINQIKAGVRNCLYASNPEPYFKADLYADAFFSDPTIPQLIPRLYLWLGWRLPSLHLIFHNAWNFRHHTVEFSIARCKWTINENIALSLEGRYRSPYDWRKADHENFLLDVTRPESELLSSPLSDRRITLLADLFIRFSPFWECRIQSHHGFYRMTEDPYNEFEVNLFTWLSSAAKLRITFSHTDKETFRFGFGVDLIKK